MEAGPRLSALLAELHEFRERMGQNCTLNYGNGMAEALALQGICLIHGLREVDSVLEQGTLLSKERLRMAPSEAQEYLGTHRQVCTSAGVLYPDRIAAFLFAPEIERSVPAEGSPWDTGEFCKNLCPTLHPMPSPERRQVVHRHTLPAPEYRTYMVHYVATHYRSHHDYLGGQPPRFQDALGAMGKSPLSRIFEVRFKDALPLRTPALRAIFIPRYLGGPASMRRREVLRKFSESGVEVQYYDAAREKLGTTVRAWIRARPSRSEERP